MKRPQPAADATTWLFVPGDRPERFYKATSSGADAVILDLEDSVNHEQKGTARDHVVAWLAHHPAWVRVNAVGTPWHEDDVRSLADPALTGLQGVVVPMAAEAAALTTIHAALDTEIVALVETAQGIDCAKELAAGKGVVRLAFGLLDFVHDIDASESREATLLARSTLVMASRLAGLSAPVDSPTSNVKDPAVAADEARYARKLGFGGKLCIHPAQVGPVASAFAPSQAELAWAREVLVAGEGRGAVQLDGLLIDGPVLAQARRILARAGGEQRP